MKPKVFLAPFQGITTKRYRNILARHFPGYDAVYSPFISGVGHIKVNPSKFSDVFPINDNTIETVPQFVSIDADEILAIARQLHSYGYTHVNWNMGCPFSRLANKMRGCGILPYPDTIKNLLDKIMPQMPVQLSIKTRLGYKSTDELFEVMHVFNQYPLKEIVVHPRIGTQLYRGDVHLAQFGRVLDLSRHKIVYNGDIYHSGKYIELQQQFPSIDTWMIGRGALINPFLASQMKKTKISESDKRVIVRDFHADIFNDYLQKIGPKRVFLGSLKSIWYYMNAMFDGGNLFFERIKTCTDIHDYQSIVNELLQQPFATDQTIENYYKTGLKHI